MTVSDVRYGAEVVAKTGKLHTFDSIECAASWFAATALDEVESIWVADYSTGKLIPADSALYLRGGRLHSPMGRELAAFDATIGSDTLMARYAGDVLRWADVVAYMRTQGLPGASRPTTTTEPGRT
jgi:copper chaperone NosL